MGKRSKRGAGKVKARPAPEPGPDINLRPTGGKILTAPMTREEYVQIAKQVSQHEIMSVAQALAKQVYDMVAKGVNLAPVMERIDVCLAEQNRFNIVLNALVEILIEKGAFTREELTAKAESIADEAIKKNQERHRTLVAKSRQEREAAIRAAATGGPEAAPEAEPEAEAEPAPPVEAEAE